MNLVGAANGKYNVVDAMEDPRGRFLQVSKLLADTARSHRNARSESSRSIDPDGRCLEGARCAI